ncbi:MAG: hypothetical protein AB8B99_09500 [Phormidesmis sp.]
MCTPQNDRSIERPNPLNLTDTYRQLEGFTGWNSATIVNSRTLTMVDVYNETTHASRDDASRDDAGSNDEASGDWVDMFVTVAVMLFLMVTSSAALGFAASRVAMMTQQLTQQVDNLNDASSWNF